MNTFLHSNTHRIFFTCIITSILAMSGAHIARASTSCTILTKDLSLGSTNSTSKYQVSALQNFLYSEGYSKTPATGRYGSLTVAAVKKFQAAHSLSAVGKVGSLTRAAIEKMSCVATAPLTTPLVNTISTNTTPSSTTSTNQNIIIASGNITSATGGTVNAPGQWAHLTTGQKYLIQWTGGNNQSSVSVVLKDASGAGAGYVAQNLSGSTNQYNWTVGNVSVAGQQATVVPPGNYQLSVIDDQSFGSSFTAKSSLFSIAEAPLFINHILPPQVPNDGKTTVVLYGSGFSSSTRAMLSGNTMSYTPIITPQYISSDGTLIWFYVPQYVTPGAYNVSLYNKYVSSDPLATSTPSNTVSLQITQGQ